ncbi:MAG: orotate phosphoribosyltransferase [Calditrichia bacterium]|nr:orotate phosphoribosyltransferase [Calditrichia bacterium]
MTDEILEIFQKSGALLEGHFHLTSGLHSPTYFQCALVLQYPEYNQFLAKRIVTHFKSELIDVVISPAIGGIVVGQEVGRQLGVRTIFAERKDGKMILRRGFELGSGEKVLVCEDVVTTGGSVYEVIDLVKGEGAEVKGVGIIVDRSNGSVDFYVEQYAVVQLNAETFSPETCPLCQKGVPIQKPGSR